MLSISEMGDRFWEIGIGSSVARDETSDPGKNFFKINGIGSSDPPFFWKSKL